MSNVALEDHLIKAYTSYHELYDAPPETHILVSHGGKFYYVWVDSTTKTFRYEEDHRVGR